MNFRKATLADTEQVYALYRSVVGSEFCVWSDEYPGQFEIEQDLAAKSLFVLTNGGEIVGAISIVPENELDDFDFWKNKDGAHKEIARVVVAESRRGNAFALEMVRKVADLLCKSGCTSLRLSVAKTNIPACKTYIKAGFATVGEAHLYGGEYYLMEKNLIASK